MLSRNFFRGGLALAVALALMCALAGVPGEIAGDGSSEDSTLGLAIWAKSFSPAIELLPVLSCNAPETPRGELVQLPTAQSERLREGSPLSPRSPPFNI